MDEDTASETRAACYRHPDRVSGLSCSECGRVICGDCATPAPVGQRCPECLRRQGRQTVIDGRHVSRSPLVGAPATMAIIVVAAVFQLMFWARPELWGVLFTHLAMNNLMIAEGEWWRMFTVVLLHAGLIHVAFNSLLLYQLGTALERQIGSARLFMAFLVSTAWGSAWAFLLGDPGDIGVGMSGAVFGVVGIWLASGLRHRHTRQGRYVLDQMRGLIVLNAVVPFVLPQVSWQAHLGGLVGGFVLGQTWAKVRGERAVAAHLVIALGLMALAVAATRF